MLTTLQTNLKSLGFGKDRPQEGSSNQPYITTPIPGNNDPLPENPLDNEDFLLRGGINAPADTFEDVERLFRYFKDLESPRGSLFTVKQNLLSKISIRTQASGIGVNDGVYTPLNTLAQAGMITFGGHIPKQGIIPIAGAATYSDQFITPTSVKSFENIPTPDIEAEIDVIGEEGGKGNRLVQLTQIKIDNSLKFKKKFKIKNQIARFDWNILSYAGGPNSALGIGGTRIKFATDPQQAPLRTGVNNSKKIRIGSKEVSISANKFQPISEEADQIIPLPLGASSNYNKITSNPDNIIDINKIVANSTEGYYNSFETSVYQSGSLLLSKTNPSLSTGSKENPIADFISPLGVSKQLGKISIQNGGSGLENGTITVQNLFNSSTPAYHIGKQEGFWQLTDTVSSVYDKPDIGGIYPLSNNIRMFDNNTFTLNTQQLQEKAILSREKGKDELPDFRATLIRDNGIKKSSTLSISPDYENAKNRAIEGPTDSRINYASPGQKGNIISYTKGKINSLGKVNITDRINALPLYRSSNVAATQEGDAGGTKNDLVKFRIASIDTNNPSKKTYTHFRAYIDSFSDQYNGSWNSQKYMGRGEAFYKYDHFKRDINISFTVAAQSKPEIMVMYRKLNYLASNLAPEYTSAGYMAGSLVQLTMGGWCYELPGFISSLTLDIPQESPWEIGINDKGTFDNTVKEMPHIIKVSGLTFTPIHTFRPAKMNLTKAMKKPDSNLRDENEYGNERYIALKAVNNNYDNKVNWYAK